MGIPIDSLLTDGRNLYELTVAIVRRAHQVGEIRRAFSSDEEGAIIEDGDKVVSQAIGEVVTREVQFELNEG